ncbi:unnamed protein product [Lymnaea stagnalis]|uniref:Carboxylic ester hydrolase n=1 Tax=Lymnaea stagnalis TaxID=6523 RepID=A0AAV2IDW8_LYMST
MKQISTLFCILALHVFASEAQETEVVKTPAGRLRGLKVTASNGQSLWAFRGIPFAQPPVRQLRFSKPLAFPVQSEIIDATRQRASCIQAEAKLAPNEMTSEDCLFLNIFVKDLQGSPAARKKVLVYIHGGAFFLGSSFVFSPGSIVTDHDIIVVVIQYRIGALGFLTTRNQAALGNYALWDQVLALKWVKDNIGAFGGDANDVTVAGESAGSMSVSILTLSPETKGLFTKAYSASGVAMSTITDYRNSDSIIMSLAKSLNCWNKTDTVKLDTITSVEVVQCLRARPSSDFAKIQFATSSKPIYVPWVDGEIIPRSPRDLLKDTEYLKSIGFYDRRYLYSVTNNEQSVLAQFLAETKMHIYSNKTLSEEDKEKSWRNALSASTRKSVYDILGAEHATDKNIRTAQDWYSARRSAPYDVYELNADLTFIIPTFDFLDVIAKSGRTYSWLLYFNHYPKVITGNSKGVAHGLDLAYWFDFNTDTIRRRFVAGIGEFEEEDLNLKKVFSSVVANFAIHGNPESPLLDLGSCRWRPNGSYYLNFKPRATVERNLRLEQRQLWTKEVLGTCSEEWGATSGFKFWSAYSITSFTVLLTSFCVSFIPLL